MDLKKFNLPRYLATLPLFSNMRDEELARLASGCQLRRMERGKLVFRTGEPCQEFHVTVLGQVKLFAIAPNGTEKVIELCGPGHSFAEAVMFMDMPYMISAQTLTDSLILTPDGQVKFPHPWPPQIPPGRTTRL
ncbi:MAG: cyclic nucleotide-binding domain-containing protein [Rubrivivax sp.]|nr:cyclic nucleotide-binding domain-containing protein [Rubrivivax sp.]